MERKIKKEKRTRIQLKNLRKQIAYTLRTSRVRNKIFIEQYNF